jgi:hypothetical protein
MRVVSHELEIFEAKVAQSAHHGVQFHSRKRTRGARKLFLCLLEMISVKMEIAEGMNKFTTR